MQSVGLYHLELFDIASRLIAIVDALSDRSSIGYDADSRQASQTNALGIQTRPCTTLPTGLSPRLTRRNTQIYDL